MGFQIASASFAVILTLLASISLLTHGRWDYHDDVYDPEGIFIIQIRTFVKWFGLYELFFFIYVYLQLVDA